MQKTTAVLLAIGMLFSSGFVVAADDMKKDPMAAAKKMDTTGKPDMKQDDMKKAETTKDPMKKDAMMPKPDMSKGDMKK